MDIMVTISNMTTLEDLDKFISNGVNVLRFNFSHIQFEYFKKIYHYVKQKYPEVKLLQERAIHELVNQISNKDEVVLRNEIEEIDAVEIAVKAELISPVAAEDGSVYTDENGVLYSL